MSTPILDANKGFLVNIISPDNSIYKGTVKSLSATNVEGPFDILSYHINFVSIIQGNVKVVDMNNTKKEFPIGSGILKALNNTVYVFVGIDQKLQAQTMG